MEPADQSLFLAAAVIFALVGDPVGIRQCNTQVGIFLRFFGRLGDHHGLHALDSGQLILGIFQLQLQLLDVQTLPLQCQVGKGGVKAHEHITLFHGITWGDFDLRNGLGAGKKNGLDLVAADIAGAFLGIAPVFGHADVIEGENIHRILRGPGGKVNARTDGSHQNQTGDGDEDPLQPGFTLQFRFLLSDGCRWCSVRRPGCNRFCPRRRQYPVRG